MLSGGSFGKYSKVVSGYDENKKVQYKPLPACSNLVWAPAHAINQTYARSDVSRLYFLNIVILFWAYEKRKLNQILGSISSFPLKSPKTLSFWMDLLAIKIKYRRTRRGWECCRRLEASNQEKVHFFLPIPWLVVMLLSSTFLCCRSFRRCFSRCGCCLDTFVGSDFEENSTES